MGWSAGAVCQESSGQWARPLRPAKLLVLDTSFSLEAIRERGLEHSVTCRDIGGFFDHVWSVHPFATLVTSEVWSERFGSPEVTELAPRHTFIEGKIGRYGFLRGLAPINFFFAQLAIFLMLYRLIKRENISVIRVGDPLYLGAFGLALARLASIPLLIRVNGNNRKIRAARGGPLMPRLFPSVKLEEALERFVFARADLAACVNADNLEYAVSAGARREFTTIFRYGNLIDKRHLEPPAGRSGGAAYCAELGLEPSRFAMYVGRIIKEKHPDDLIHVLAEVRGRGHDIKLLLVGDGNMRDELLELATGLDVAEALVMCGNKNQGWLAAVTPQAAAVLSPITGRALTEQAFAAAPIVAFDIDWQSELIETGKTGELVSYRSTTEMADSLERFLLDADYAKAMGEGARARAMDLLDPDALNQHEREEYQKLLEHAGRT